MVNKNNVVKKVLLNNFIEKAHQEKQAQRLSQFQRKEQFYKDSFYSIYKRVRQVMKKIENLEFTRATNGNLSLELTNLQLEMSKLKQECESCIELCLGEPTMTTIDQRRKNRPTTNITDEVFNLLPQYVPTYETPQNMTSNLSFIEQEKRGDNKNLFSELTSIHSQTNRTSTINRDTFKTPKSNTTFQKQKLLHEKTLEKSMEDLYMNFIIENDTSMKTVLEEFDNLNDTLQKSNDKKSANI